MTHASLTQARPVGWTQPEAPASSMRESFAQTTARLLDEDLSVVLVLADISAGYFVEAAARHPERVINVGIREQLAINVGAGLALAGMRPVVHTFAPFLVERGFEQIKLGFGHQGVAGVLVSAGASYDNSTSGRTHQSPSDVALLDTLPGWTIHVPGHPDELSALLSSAVMGADCVYLRSSTRCNATASPTGRMHVVTRGARGTVVAVGPTLDATLAASDGLDLTVLYAATVRPFDKATLAETLTAPDVILVEPYAAGTSAAEVADALLHVPHRLLSLGVPRLELRRYGTPAEHDAAYGLDAVGLRRSFVSFLHG
jgi:transketolase